MNQPIELTPDIIPVILSAFKHPRGVIEWDYDDDLLNINISVQAQSDPNATIVLTLAIADDGDDTVYLA